MRPKHRMDTRSDTAATPEVDEDLVEQFGEEEDDPFMLELELPIEETQTRRRFLRDTVHAFGEGASGLLSVSRGSSRVVDFTVGTMEKLMSPALSTLSGLEGYYDPILDSLDERLDSVMSAVHAMSFREEGVEVEHKWERLRHLFHETEWFKDVSFILVDANPDEPLSQHEFGDVFYKAAMDTFVRCGDLASFEEELQLELDDMWDDRLLEPAHVFYSTAKMASSLVGVTRFLDGAIQFGRETLSVAMRQLLSRWDGSTEEVDEGQMLSTTEDQKRDTAVQQSQSMNNNQPSCNLDDANNNDRKRDRPAQCLLSPGKRRVKQCVPMSPVSSDVLRQQLSETWFQEVDDILKQNVVVKSFGNATRPANFFFQTCIDKLRDQSQETAGFIASLRHELRNAWDEQLAEHAAALYTRAWDHKPTTACTST